MTFYLLKNFNNYYNRQIKRYDTAEEYIAQGTLVHTCQTSNFNPRDGVTTQHIFNIQLYDTPDYCIVCEETNNTIVSRWFITESEYTSAGQYLVHLYRDVIAEEFEKIINAPCFIEKATISSGPLLYNKENMSYNQVKQSEVLLKDSTQTSWIVGYLNKGVTPANPITTNYTTTPDLSVANLAGWDYYQYTQAGTRFSAFPDYREWTFYMRELDNTSVAWKYVVHVDNSALNNYRRVSADGNKFYVSEGSIPGTMQRGLALQSLYNKATVWDSQIPTLAPQLHSKADTDEFRGLNGKTIKDISTGKLYSIRVNYYTNAGNLQGYVYPSMSLFTDNFLPWVDSSDYFQRATGTCDNSGVFYEFTYDMLSISLTELRGDLNINWTNAHNVCPQETFDMFCMPAEQLYVRTGVNTGFYVNGEVSFKSYSAIDMALTSGQLLDIQLLPYCPVLSEYSDPERVVTSYGKAMTLDISGKTEHKNYDLIKDNNSNPIGIMFWAQSARFSRSYNNSHQDLETGSTVNYINYDLSTPQKIKITNECDIYRICSPNYNGQFDLNIAKNGGFLGFNIHCAYKPFTPYIQIEPVFGGLYGSSFKDARGLICGGDFSLPQKDSKWAEYQLQNKNYQVMFDRQIQNMTDMNEIALKEARWSLFAGSLTGAGAGAAAGAMIAGPTGAVLGGATGLSASLLGGAADIDILKQRQALTLDYTEDMFGYNLENIQALPYSITKVGAFVPTNKIFPFIEYYTCTDEEKQALKDKMKWNGMTVGIIGKISDYIINEPSYIKGRIIRLESLAEDYHYATVIGEEITKGVYI